jgi:hypothetical protein
MNDRLDALEGQLRRATPDPEAERRHRENIEALDRFAAIVRDSGPRFDNHLAVIQEKYPQLPHYERQLLVKKRLVLESPGGRELWRRLVAISGGRLDAQLRGR